MSEASGSIIIRVPDNQLMKNLAKSKGIIGGDVVLSLLAQAGVSPICSANDDFSHEGVSRQKGYVCIDVFGDEWMPVFRHIVESGSNIELYGSISHEYGFEEYYAISTDGLSFFGTLDYESGEAVNEDDLIQQWLTKVPNPVRQKFPELFSTEDADVKLDVPSNFDEVVGVWNAKKVRPGVDEAYMVIRPDKTEVFYFKEKGKDSFQYYESVLEAQGGDRYMSVSKGAVVESSRDFYAGSEEAICLFRKKDSLVYCEMDEIFEDAQNSAVCPPAAISEEDIQPIAQVEYRQPQ